ncbi:ATP-binding protein [Streptomyces monticola]|uniref:ATP-binding protein n=1 Tax=Streptomyces monticola TaxID=2666263 RepID=A0ABW2JBV2_9ACTN
MSPHTDTDSPAASAPHYLCFRGAPRPITPHSNDSTTRSATFAFPSAPERIAEVRHAVAAVLTYWNVDEDVRDMAVLTVSELATNAVVHAAGSASITVLVEVASDLHVAVRDGSRKLPARKDPRGADNENSRGLAIVAALCSEWGTTVYGDGTKSVWANFLLPRGDSA